MYINFHYLSERNTVSLSRSFFLSNDLISDPPGNLYTQGGGMHVLFDNNKATGTTNNVVLTIRVMFADNNARDGVGGGLSVLYVHSPKVRVSGDKVCLNRSAFLEQPGNKRSSNCLAIFSKVQKGLVHRGHLE